MVKIFTFRDNKLELDNPNILLIPEFAILLNRDSSKDKAQAFKEFNYIYQRADYRSYPVRNGLGDTEAHAYSVKTAQLPLDYIVGAEIDNAIKKYRNEQESVIIRLNNEILRSFNNFYAAVQIINDSVDYLITQVKKIKKDHPEDTNRIDTLTSSIIDNQEKLLSISKAIPAQIEVHKSYEILLKKEEDRKRTSYGGGAIITSMQPRKK